MIHQTFIQAIELSVLMAVIIAFIIARQKSVSVHSFLATVSWNG